MNAHVAKKLILELKLMPHPEGGYFRRTYQSDREITLDTHERRFLATATYYLLEKHDFSCWHRLKSDELWHFYCGGPLTLYEINHHGELIKTIIGNPLEDPKAHLQHCVRANTWFAAMPNQQTAFTLLGLTVFPGFDFNDFEMGKRDELLRQWPEHNEIIRKFIRD